MFELFLVRRYGEEKVAFIFGSGPLQILPVSDVPTKLQRFACECLKIQARIWVRYQRIMSARACQIMKTLGRSVRILPVRCKSFRFSKNGCVGLIFFRTAEPLRLVLETYFNHRHRKDVHKTDTSSIVTLINNFYKSTSPSSCREEVVQLSTSLASVMGHELVIWPTNSNGTPKVHTNLPYLPSSSQHALQYNR